MIDAGMHKIRLSHAAYIPQLEAYPEVFERFELLLRRPCNARGGSRLFALTPGCQLVFVGERIEVEIYAWLSAFCKLPGSVVLLLGTGRTP
jgi:hypothetical protein